MKDISLVTIVGARPQFIKAAAVSRAIAEYNGQGSNQLQERIVHTGQHYDQKMSEVFFDQLHIPHPSVNLQIGSSTHGRQTGAMLDAIEQVLLNDRPDWVLVYGDTNSTLAGALAAVKLHIPIAHVEAGLRSFNRRMPEEINRILTDHISTRLFCPTGTAVRNLANEGIVEGVMQTGDVMYDSVLFHARQAADSSKILQEMSLAPKSFFLATVHRAENTDDPARLSAIVSTLEALDHPIVLPLHPRTKKILGSRLEGSRTIRVIEPVPYLDMIQLERTAGLILTDSGGVQKEAYWLAVPCVTLRDQTEWVELVQGGYNAVVGVDPQRILAAVAKFRDAGFQLPQDRPLDLYGDGKSAQQIVVELAKGL